MSIIRTRGRGWMVLVALVSLLGALASGEDAQAASYGDFSTAGGAVDLNGVEDDTGAFGAPTPAANGLVFDLLQVSTRCGVVGGSCPSFGFGSVSEGLRFGISADAATAPSAIVIRQRGRTTLLAPGDEQAISTISTTVGVDIFEVDGITVNNLNIAVQLAFDAGGTYSAADAAGGLVDFAFSGELTIDLAALLAANATTGIATLMGIDLSTLLTAFGDGAENALISTDSLEILFVPEPNTALLIGLGLLALRWPRSDRGSTRDREKSIG